MADEPRWEDPGSDDVVSTPLERVFERVGEKLRHWRGKQWIDRHGRTWLEDANGLWWHNSMSVSDLLIFDPARRRPPSEFGPYRRATVEVRASRIIDLCPSLARLT